MWLQQPSSTPELSWPWQLWWELSRKHWALTNQMEQWAGQRSWINRSPHRLVRTEEASWEVRGASPVAPFLPIQCCFCVCMYEYLCDCGYLYSTRRSSLENGKWLIWISNCYEHKCLSDHFFHFHLWAATSLPTTAEKANPSYCIISHNFHIKENMQLLPSHPLRGWGEERWVS